MLRNKPRLKYCGLTVILSNPSRFDTVRLLTSTGGNFIDQFCFQPSFGLMNTDIRLMEDSSSFLEGTTCILLLGENAMHKYVPSTKNNTIHEMRGSIFSISNTPAIPSYLPQDCTDAKNYEREFNEQAEGYDNEEEFEGEDDETGDVKAFSKTARKNYGFWLYRDILKCKKLMVSGMPTKRTPDIKIIPSGNEVIEILSDTKDKYLDTDIETDYEDQNLLCFSFTFGGTIYSVPALDHNYKPYYSNLERIIASYERALQNNIAVFHNGHAFDLFVLAKKYRLACGERVYDTMIAQHRCFPGVEKSLGHCISLWTNENFHKDTDSESYRTYSDMLAKLEYCARDVYGMKLVREAQLAYAKTIPGLEDSIRVANESIRAYLITTLQGMRYDPVKVKEIVTENDSLMEEYIRIAKILIGPIGMEEVKAAVKGKAGSVLGSRTQLAKYFHDILGYPVIFKSTKTGEPSLGKKTMFKLQLKHDNPVLALVNTYRTVQKETGALSFNPWKDDEGNVFPRVKENV